MKSPSSLALKDLFNDSAKIIEEFQAQCFLMASEFNELAKGNIITDYDYPTFTNEIKRICYNSNTVKKEVTNINQLLFNENDENKGFSYIDSLLTEMAKRTRKPLGQSFMKKVRHTFPETPYRNIRARIIQLISEGKIIDYTEEDEARRDPTKSKRGHPRTKWPENPTIPNLTQEQLKQFEQMIPIQQMQQLQQLQQLQFSQQQQQNMQTQQSLQNANFINLDTNSVENANSIDQNTNLDDTEIPIEDGAMAAAVDLDEPQKHSHFDTMSEGSEEDTLDFETAFDQAVGILSESPNSQESNNISEPANNNSSTTASPD